MSIRTIQAHTESLPAYLSRVWQSRGLILTMAKRDLKAQYAQTFLGILWSAIQPLSGLAVFTLFFDVMLKMDLDLNKDIPYPLFAFSGMLSWYYFTYLVSQAGTSLVNNQDLIKKIYFPKLVLPFSKVLVGMVDFGISLIILIFMVLVWADDPPGINMVFLPLFILLNIMVGLSVAIWLAALTIRYRDFQHIIPYLVNFGIWLTPVFFPATIIPEGFENAVYLNPMAGIIAGFRWCVMGIDLQQGVPNLDAFLYYLPSFAVAAVILIAGLLYFRKVEKTIADFV